MGPLIIANWFNSHPTFSPPATGTPSPKKLGRRGSTFSSVRLSQRVPSNPIRRNTTRVRGRSYHQKKVREFIWMQCLTLVSDISFSSSQVTASETFDNHDIQLPKFLQSVASIKRGINKTGSSASESRGDVAD